MKKWLGVITALMLVLVCATALATGTYAISTEKELFSGGFSGQQEALDKIAAQAEKAFHAEKSNAVYLDETVNPPDVVRATSVNNRVSLSWEDNDKEVVLWAVYEKISGKWTFLKAVAGKVYNINGVSDGEHTYGVASIKYDSDTGNYYESKYVTFVTLKVFDGSDQPGTGADVREINLAGTKDREISLTVYDNTFLHITTDSLTWYGDTTIPSVMAPDTEDGLRFTTLGNDVCVKATRHYPALVVVTCDYSESKVDGKTLYSVTGNRAMYTIYMTYVRGNVKDGILYQLNQSKKTAAVIGVADKKTTKVIIPKTVKMNGKAYKVTSVAASAMKGLSKLKTLIIGGNVKEIGKNAFSGCKNLKSITIKTTRLTSSGVKSGAFRNCSKVTTVKCPGSKKTAYRKLLVNRGIPKKAKFK